MLVHRLQLYFSLRLIKQEDTMGVTTLVFRLLMVVCILMGTQVQDVYTQQSDAVVLHITPNRQQHFEYETVSFRCESTNGFAELRRVKSVKEFDPACVIERTPTGSLCRIDRVYSEDSGEYWCETEGGERSNSVNIIITGSVILESPALPVNEGEPVTLRCRSKIGTSKSTVDFYKDYHFMKYSPTGEISITYTTKSNEGFYKCSIPDIGESPGSWLAVRVIANPGPTFSPSPHKETTSSDQEESASSDPVSSNVLIPLCVAAAIVMMVLVLLLVRFLHVSKHKVSSNTQTAVLHSGQGDLVCGDDSADDLDSVTYSVVVVKPRQKQETADAADNLSLHLETNHSRNPQKEGESGSYGSTGNLNAAAATDPDSAQLEPLYSNVQMATKSPD